MDIDASRKWNADRQKHTFNGKLVTCYNCQQKGHMASNCRSPQRSIPAPRGNTGRKMGGRGCHTHADMLEVALSAEHNTKTTSSAGGAGASI